MRLDQLLINHLQLSRRMVKRLIKGKSVMIDQQVAIHSGHNVDASIQNITVRGERVVDNSQKYYMLNKPKGSISATTDPHQLTVIDLLKKERVENLYPVGRLDADTEGLLLITNNGPLGYRLLHPTHHVEKEYYVEVNGPLSLKNCEDFSRGIIFHGGERCKPSLLTILSTSSTHSTARVIISEGKFHQIKKMFLSIGVKVTYLKRIRFAFLTLDESLAPGEYRPLLPEELVRLKTFFD